MNDIPFPADLNAGRLGVGAVLVQDVNKSWSFQHLRSPISPPNFRYHKGWILALYHNLDTLGRHISIVGP